MRKKEESEVQEEFERNKNSDHQIKLDNNTLEPFKAKGKKKVSNNRKILHF